MKLSRSKMAIYGGVLAAMIIMPIAPTLVDAGTTHKQQQSTNLDKEQITASYSENIANIVAETYNQMVEHGMFYNVALSIADTNVYASDSEDSEVVGQLYEKNIAGVVEIGTEWTKIESGEAAGYVKTAGLCFDKEAEAISAQNGGVTVHPNVDGTLIYSAAYSESPINTTDTTATFAALGTCSEYTVIQLEDGTKAYIKSEDVSIDYGFNFGKSTAQIEAEEAARVAEEAAKAAEAKAAEEAAQAASSTSSESAPSYGASYDETYLLACIIHWEACGEPYDGMIAVGNVVLNRVRSGSWGSSITDVVYAPGQFSGVTDGNRNPSSAFQARLASGPSAACMSAAQEALAGVNVAGNYMYFRMSSGATPSRYSSYMVLGNHTFYNY